MATPSRFVFVTCQVGAESALKAEVAREWPDFRFAYSRPGFLTFRIPDDVALFADFDLKSVFARAYGFSLGTVRGDDPVEMARQVWEVYGERPVRHVHVWSRDTVAAGERDFEPRRTEADDAVHGQLLAACPRPDQLRPEARDPGSPAVRGDFICDCVRVSPGEWWVGVHRARDFHSRHAGGLLDLSLPSDAASRAWLKFEEGLRWADFPFTPGARCADIGCAPGGSSQALLARGLHVLGVDPAEVAPQVAEHAQFVHLRKRASDVKRREFRKARWLFADMNVAPVYTLDALEAIVTHPEIHVRGLLFTLKLFEWSLAAELPAHAERIRSWGYNLVKMRQLQFNRQEVSVAALQRPFRRKIEKNVAFGDAEQ